MNSESIFNMHNGHRQRLRNRVEAEGIEVLKPHEIIEFLLCYTIPRQNVNHLAHNLIDHFGSVDAVLRADAQQLGQVSGIGRHTADWLMKIGEVLRHGSRTQSSDRPQLKNYLSIYRYAAQLRCTHTPQCSLQLCLDFSNRLVYQCEITPSLAWGEISTLRSALHDMFVSRAKYAVIVQMTGSLHARVHNYDLAHIRTYAETLNAAGCTLLDVLLVNDYEIFSLRSEGHIPDLDLSPAARALYESYLSPENEPEDLT